VTFPTTVRIGCIEYSINLVAQPELDGEPKLGTIDYRKLEIEIDEEMHPDVQIVTLWHEILHGIDDQHNLGLTDGKTDALAYGIVQVLRDNSWLRDIGAVK
jgi:hypothetical protein